MRESPSYDEAGDPPLLNEPQRRHFEVFLAMLEHALDTIQRLAVLPNETNGESLTVYDADLPPTFESHALSVKASVRQEIDSLARSLGIRTQHRSRTRTVRALLTAELVRLDDSYARKLRGYGAVNPRVEQEVDPVLDRIRGELAFLLDSTETPGSNENPSRNRGSLAE